MRNAKELLTELWWGVNISDETYNNIPVELINEISYCIDEEDVPQMEGSHV